MQNVEIVKTEKKIVPFSIKENLLCQYLLFPIVFTLMTIMPLGIYAFVHIFISVYNRDNLLNIIVLTSGAVIVSFLIGLLLAVRIRAVAPETALYNRLAIFTAPALNAVAVFIAYIAGGFLPAKIILFVVNPFFVLDNFMFNFILGNYMIIVLLLSSLSYSVAFFIFSGKAFGLDKKNLQRVFALITAAVTAVSFASCTFIFYPELEYEVLKAKYESLPFNEEVDYKFYENLPFAKDNKLVKLEEEPLLSFWDVETTPRLDGATAFYPIYASVAENCYNGLRNEIAENELYFGEDDGDDNIRLYIPYNLSENPVINRCAELINCTQTTRAYNGLADGKSDIVFAFEPSKEQIAYAAEKGVEFELKPIGYDAFCFFVNKQNPVDSLTLKQVQDIYSGKILNWKQVGGQNKRVFPFTRPKNSGSQTIMENLVMKDVAINTRFEAKEVRTMGQIINVVDGYLNTPAAIGYTFMYYSSFMVTAESIKYIAIDGVAPSSETVKTGAYIFSAPFYAVTAKGRETKETSELVDWLTGQQGQRLIEQCGYVRL